MTQRIESGTTGVGIPDLYVAGPEGTAWIELKNLKTQHMAHRVFEVSWRPGQQAWALRHYKACKKHTFTLCALYSGFILIPMIRLYENNIVYSTEGCCFTELSDILLLKEKIFR